MEYIDDDLKFLKDVESSKLDRLRDILLQDANGNKRFAAFKDSFDLQKQKEEDRWQVLARELQCFGGNSLANTVRGSGVKYEEIVDDVASVMELSNQLRWKNVVEKELVIIEELKNALISKNLEKYMSLFPQKINDMLNNNPVLTKLGKQTKQNLLKRIKENYSLETLQSELRNNYDSSSKMEKLLEYAGSERKNVLYKIGNLFCPLLLKIFNPNWSVITQSIVEISRLRSSTSGMSVAILGATGSGKSTILSYLQNGRFISIDKGTSGVEQYDSFYSPLMKTSIKAGSDVSGGNFYIDTQKDLCRNKDLIFFCYNPKEIMESKEKQNDFFERLGVLKDIDETEKIIFIATHSDTYSKEEMKMKLFEMMHSNDMGDVPEKFKVDNSFYINLKDEHQTKEMFELIKNICGEK